MLRILYASRAYESPPNEGGFILLRDLAESIGKLKNMQCSFFSLHGDFDSTPRKIKLYKKCGWSRENSLRFLMGLTANQHHFDIIHVAHMPTLTNSVIMRRISDTGRKKGVKYVQTVTALPGHPANSALRQFLWGDRIVCLNPMIKEHLQKVRSDITQLPAIPSPERIEISSNQPANHILPGNMRCIAIPFHFMHLPDRFDILGLVTQILRRHRDVYILLPYRLTEAGKAYSLQKSLPIDLRARFFVLDAQNNVLAFLKRAELVIYPVSAAPRKFNPPLILLEAVTMGCKLVTSASMHLPPFIADNSVRQLSDHNIGIWMDTIDEMLVSVSRQTAPTHKAYKSYISKYLDIYNNI